VKNNIFPIQYDKEPEKSNLMRNSTKHLSVLIIVILIFAFTSQIRAAGFQYNKMRIDTLTWNSLANPDCLYETYKYDDSVADNGYTYGVPGLVQLGNYYPISDTCSGVIKSADIYFSSNSMTSAQSCVLYIYNANHIIVGQGAPFINTGSPWPDGTWVHVPLPSIPYTGPFYAMVDYTITQTPDKNLFDVDTTTIQSGFPHGLGFVDIDGVWTPASVTLGGSSIATFLERINVCGCGGTVGVKELKPVSVSLSPNPANDFVNIVSTNNISTIEILNFTGQTIYKMGDVNLKVTKLNVAGFNEGEYFVKITTIYGIKTLKFTVIH
jgi:hypothetical protein